MCVCNVFICDRVERVGRDAAVVSVRPRRSDCTRPFCLSITIFCVVDVRSNCRINRAVQEGQHWRSVAQTAEQERDAVLADGDGRRNETGATRSVDEDELRDLRSQLRSVSQRLEKATVRMEKLQNDLRLAHKALQREVGDDVPLDEVLDAARHGGDSSSSNSASMAPTANRSGWRGRAQTILLLRQKLKKLSQQLREAHDRTPTTDSTAVRSPGTTASHGDCMAALDVDAKAEQRLAGMRDARMRRVDDLEDELGVVSFFYPLLLRLYHQIVLS